MSAKPRFIKMKLTPFGMGWLHRRNPWVALACSVALPGLGHFYCGAYGRGFILMTWEIVVNQLSRLNLAIFLTVMGHMDKARLVVNYEWLLFYPVFYMVSIWDSYRLAVDINARCDIEEAQPVRHFETMALSPWGVAFLGKRNPWLSFFLAAFLGGGGHIYNFMLSKAAMLMGWHLLIWMNSGLGASIIAIVRGDWVEAHHALDYQWLLFFPSLHIFNMWNAYSDTVELNRLYEEELAYFIQQTTAQQPAALPSGGTPCANEPS